MADLKLTVDSSEAEQALEVVERLILAISKAKEALDDLNNAAHGGVTIKIVGDLCVVEVSPPEYVEVQTLGESEPRKVRAT